MKKTILVFGATGGIGAYTVRHLVECKLYNIIAIGHRKSDNGYFASLGVEYFSVNIANKDDFKQLPKTNIDTIINLAGVLPANKFAPELMIQSFTLGTLNILEYMRCVGCKRIITAQTPADLWYLQNTTEAMPADAMRSFPPTGDHSIYTIAKNAAIDIIEYYHNTYGFERFILRFFNVYLYHPNAYYCVDGIKRMISFRLLMHKAELGEDIEVWGDPSRSKEMLYIKDLTDVIKNCIEIKSAGGIYNVGGERPISLEEQIDGIINIFSSDQKKSKKIYCPEKPNALLNHLDISKTIKELNYKPQYSYIDSLIDIKKEMENQHFIKLWGDSQKYE